MYKVYMRLRQSCSSTLSFCWSVLCQNPAVCHAGHAIISRQRPLRFQEQDGYCVTIQPLIGDRHRLTIGQGLLSHLG
jgi:hypothetical protein